MDKSEIRLNRITAIIKASEDAVERAKVHGDKYSILVAKEVAFDHIMAVVKGDNEE